MADTPVLLGEAAALLEELSPMLGTATTVGGAASGFGHDDLELLPELRLLTCVRWLLLALLLALLLHPAPARLALPVPSSCPIVGHARARAGMFTPLCQPRLVLQPSTAT